MLQPVRQAPLILRTERDFGKGGGKYVLCPQAGQPPDGRLCLFDGQSRPPKLWCFVPVVACSVLNSAVAGVTGAIYSVLLVPCIGIAMKQFLSAPSSHEPIEQVAGQT